MRARIPHKLGQIYKSKIRGYYFDLLPKLVDKNTSNLRMNRDA